MNIGWLCLDGTNSWDTVSTTGTDINVRVPLFNRLHDRGDKVIWFGLKPNSHLLEGDDLDFMRPHNEAIEICKVNVRAAQKIWDENNKKRKWQKKHNAEGYPMSKWVGHAAVTATLATWDKNKNLLPNCDAFIAEYMDTGLGILVLFTSLLVHYARRGTPLYVIDFERRFRYVTELKLLHDEPRGNMYEHRLERYIPHSCIDDLRGKIRMIYPFACDWDDGTNGYYKTPSIDLSVVYDVKRELSLPRLREKLAPIVMVGNDNKRRPFIEKWYGGLKYRADIYGNWAKRDSTYVESWREINRKVRFHEPVGQHELLQTLRTGYATIYHLPPMSIDLGQITYRVCEASLAGTINISPAEIKNPELYTLPQFVARDPKHLNQMLKGIMSMSEKQYQRVIQEQRKLVSHYFDADYVFDDFIEMLVMDGVDPWK